MNRIREFREAKKMTQQELGKLIGVNQSTIDRYEKEQYEVKANIAFRISTVLECGVHELMGWDGV